MTIPPDDLIDPAEARLVRRVLAYSDPAVVPVDPVAIAASAAAARPRSRWGRLGSLGNGRLGWLVTGAALTAVLVGGVIGVGALTAPEISPDPQATPNGQTVASCKAADLSARIVRWEGAAGSRIATVELSSSAAADCLLPTDTFLTLIDANQAPLIEGPIVPTHEVIAAGETRHSFVRVSNYCGSTPPEPVTILLHGSSLTDADGKLLFEPATGGLSGVPPCNGPAGANDDIEIQPWQPGPAPAD